MALTDEGGSNMVMPVAPAYGGGNGGFGGFGNDWGWIILLLLFAGGGWGMGGFGYGGMMGMGMMDGFGLYPWLNNSQNINGGFRDQMINTGITSIRDGISGLSTQICGGFGDIQMAVANGFAGVEQGANARQIANMQQAFNAQTAVTAGMNNIAMNLQNCCCENRANIADLKYTVATENCADRQALNEGVRDIIANQTAGTQRILDKLCDQELQAERRENQNLRSELMYARGQASQVAQTAELRTAAQTANANLLTELRNCPIPAQAVYGNQPVFTCQAQNNCGCQGFYN